MYEGHSNVLRSNEWYTRENEWIIKKTNLFFAKSGKHTVLRNERERQGTSMNLKVKRIINSW